MAYITVKYYKIFIISANATCFSQIYFNSGIYIYIYADGVANFILRIKEQKTHLILHKHDDDDDGGIYIYVYIYILPSYITKFY